jgi:hypothetical protein
VYQLIDAPADVAFKFEDVPHVTVEGDAVTGVGAVKIATVTVTAVLVGEVQPTIVGQVIITCPLPTRTPDAKVGEVKAPVHEEPPPP